MGFKVREYLQLGAQQYRDFFIFCVLEDRIGIHLRNSALPVNRSGMMCNVKIHASEFWSGILPLCVNNLAFREYITSFPSR